MGREPQILISGKVEATILFGISAASIPSVS
jgi:hypothetical protein